jgi:hypothetical protein
MKQLEKDFKNKIYPLPVEIMLLLVSGVIDMVASLPTPMIVGATSYRSNHH